MQLQLQSDDIELLTRCASRGTKLDLGMLRRRIGRGDWQCPAPIESGIWCLEWGGGNVVYYYLEKTLRPSLPAKRGMAYSVSLVSPSGGAGCVAVTAAMALNKARRLRTEWGIH